MRQVDTCRIDTMWGFDEQRAWDYAKFGKEAARQNEAASPKGGDAILKGDKRNATGVHRGILTMAGAGRGRWAMDRQAKPSTDQTSHAASCAPAMPMAAELR